ncbi:MAG: RluA family pseudouridine synthase [Patescibacteria group bacterium]
MNYTVNMELKKIIVASNEQNQRLDVFLVVQFPEYSRSFLKTQIQNGNITLNSKKVNAGIKIKSGDDIQLNLPTLENISIKPEKNIPINIIYEDNDFITINKQSGIVVHPSESTPAHTLVNGLIAYYPDIISVGDDPKRPGIVHRLDKDVSGIMVIAKNQRAFDHLKIQFKERSVKKKYIALVYGRIIPDNGTINTPIGRSKSQPNRMSVKRIGDGKEAETHYKTTKNFKDYTLLEIEIKTGRTHQIRVHLLSKGNPIVGDSTYYLKRMAKKTGMNRIFLHAYHIQFADLNGNLLKFNANIPEELDQFLKQLT